MGLDFGVVFVKMKSLFIIEHTASRISYMGTYLRNNMDVSH